MKMNKLFDKYIEPIMMATIGTGMILILWGLIGLFIYALVKHGL